MHPSVVCSVVFVRVVRAMWQVAPSEPPTLYLLTRVVLAEPFRKG